MAERIEHWFNRRYRERRRDVFLLRTLTGWQVIGRIGGADGQEAVHYFDHEAEARAMARRMMETVPPELADWRRMSPPRNANSLDRHP